MKKYFLSLTILMLISISFASAAFEISPEMIKQRYGFETEFVKEENGTRTLIDETTKIKTIGNYYVVFDNGIKCELGEFVYKGCGKEYRLSIPCVPIGESVWPFEHCCDFARAYSKPGVKSQPICAKISETERLANNITFGGGVTNIAVFIVIMVLVLGGLMLFPLFMKDRRDKY